MSELLLISQNTEPLGQWFSKCGPWASSISVALHLQPGQGAECRGEELGTCYKCEFSGPTLDLNQNLHGRGPAVCVSVVFQVILMYPSRGHFDRTGWSFVCSSLDHKRWQCWASYEASSGGGLWLRTNQLDWPLSS